MASEYEITEPPRKEVLNVLRLFTGSFGIRTSQNRRALRQAGEVGRKKVSYFRGKDYVMTVEQRLKSPRYNKVLCPFLQKDTWLEQRDVAQIIQRLLREKILSKADEHNPANAKPRKWPDKLVRIPGENFEPEKYYIINYEEPDPYQMYKTAAFVAVPLLLVMFPVWPLWIKIGIWYCLVLILVVFIGFIQIRSIIALVFWLIGFDFWILPNVFDETVGWIEGFWPLVSFERNRDGDMMLLTRCTVLIMCAACLQEMVRSGWTVEDLVTPVEELKNWGVNKLSPPPSVQKQYLSYDDLKKEEEQESTDKDGESMFAQDDVVEEEDASAGKDDEPVNDGEEVN